MPTNRAWAPKIVEKVARGFDPEWWAAYDQNNPTHRDHPATQAGKRAQLFVATRMLDASPLREALDLIERLVAAQTEGPDGMELWLGEVDQCIEDGLALLARVNAPKGE